MEDKVKHRPVCFHCGLNVPQESRYGLNFEGQWRVMCCPGCEAVAQAIIDNGLSSFYQKRTAYTPPSLALPDELKSYDHDQLIAAPSLPKDEVIERSLIIEGITCSACIWLLEKHVRQLSGVLSFNVNYATRRAQLKIDRNAVRLSEVLAAIQSIGYRALPYDASKQFTALQKERKDFLARIGVAVFCSMQVMMLTLGIYIADANEIDPEMLLFLKWISALLTFPVLMFSAKPFLRAAYRDIKNKMPGMDVSVALGISLGFLASLFNTYRAEGDTYYESVCMFVLFLLLARYVEFLTRWYAISSSERLTQATPVIAKRVMAAGQVESVSAKSLLLGDQIQINPGEVIPADSIIIQGSSQVDESILTGEDEPLDKTEGDSLLGGSHNLNDTLIARVSCVGEDSTLSTITRLIDRAHGEKPAWVELADRYASLFISMVILLTAGTAWYGFWQGDADWFSTALSVLVVTCPCALSLATPTAYTATMSALFERGIIITKGQALEKLANIKHVIFDKTGTLTQGSMRVFNCHLYSSLDRQSVLDIAICLEGFSDHPIARAFKREKALQHHQANHVEHKSGAGLKGVIEGENYYLGSKNYLLESLGISVNSTDTQATQVYLADNKQLLAVFEIHDDIRKGASSAIAWLKEQGKSVSLVSGDREAPVAWVAKKLAIRQYKFDASPADKLNEIERLQANGEQAAMVGDGVNDAPIMAKADVSISVSGASQLARSSSDILLMGDDMNSLQQVFQFSIKTRAIIKQNMVWALVYNIGALPLAMGGHVEPWQAALGMSVSSLVVVLNSFRLRLQSFGAKVSNST
ncbi:MAG: heavy metal translocating P-type ATPase, partial [Cycloclasticus sp.]|nr:heavy metal translocating P-type ATPase [Cycloclasticus sp.]